MRFPHAPKRKPPPRGKDDQWIRCSKCNTLTKSSTDKCLKCQRKAVMKNGGSMDSNYAMKQRRCVKCERKFLDAHGHWLCCACALVGR